MKKTVIRLGNPLAQRVMRQVAVVADGHVLVAGIHPRIKVSLHDVAIRTSLRVIAEITGALPIAKGKDADPREHPQGHGQSD